MRHPFRTAFAVMLSVVTGSTALAAEQARSGNPRAGREFVGHNCDGCHVVAADQDLRPLIAGYAPSFAAIANRPETTAETLRAFLVRQHGYSNMPYPDLAPADLANVVAYIVSLRHRQPDRHAP